MGLRENAFIAKMGSCENALLLRKEFYSDNKSTQMCAETNEDT